MKKLHILAVMILAVALSACKDDKFNLGSYSENEPARINLRINILQCLKRSSRNRKNPVNMLHLNHYTHFKPFLTVLDGITIIPHPVLMYWLYSA